MRPFRFAFACAVVATSTFGCGRKGEVENHPPDYGKQAGTKSTTDEIRLSVEAVNRSGIQIGLVTEQVLTPTFRVPARVSFNEEAFAHVGTPVPGRTIEINVRLGDVVVKGDPLMVVESPELGSAQSDYLQRRTAITAGESAVKPLQLAYERGLALYQKDQGIALAEVQKREAEVKAAEGQLETARSALKAAEQKLQTLGMDKAAIGELERYGRLNSRQLILAPISGTVVQREVTLGELVLPDKETLIVLADMTKLWIIADVPESKLSHVRKGAKAWVRVSAASQATLEGTVSVISPSLDLNTRSVQVRIDVDTKGTLLVPGMFAEAEIEDSAKERTGPVVVIPESAVQTMAGETVVFVPVDGEEGSFVKRPVKVGREVAGSLPVVSGLEAGEKIVTSGSFILKAELGKSQVEDDD